MTVQNQLIPRWLNGKLSLEKYQRLMSYPGWNYFTQSIKATRAFENGLDACLILLQYTEDIRDDLSVADYERNLQTFYFFLLTMLDRLDRWDDYLYLWENLRNNTQFSSTYTKSGLEVHGNRIQPLIMGDDGESVRVHFLYGISDRRDVIERKKARQMLGKSARKHRQQDELSNEQIKQRLDSVKARLAYASKLREASKR
jgi:hypothetical protein